MVASLPRLVSESEALAAIDRSKVKQALRSAFSGLISGATVQPAQTVTEFPQKEGDCIFYPGLIWDLNLIGVKVSPYINELKRAGKYPVTAYTILFSASSGKPILLCDSYALTTSRTAATTALALEYLTLPSAKVLTLIGVGKVGVEHLRYVSEQHKWSNIRIWSRSISTDPVKLKKVVDSLKSDGITVQVAKSAENAVRGADVVMLCTSSAEPVINVEWLSPNAIVTSISTNSPKAHEIDPRSLSEFSVFCDYRATAPVTAGEMQLAIEDGIWNPSNICGDIPELIVKKSVRPKTGLTFFRSTGLGIEDIAIASLLSDMIEK